MKNTASIIAAVSLLCACSSSASQRPSTTDERRTSIERDRDGEQQAYSRENRGDSASDDASELDAPHASRTTEEEPDNTARNARDDEPGNLTALDQSNSASDVDITQAIRKEVIANDALSFNAKNVKIITVSGKVTLRGPVESAKESAAIEKSARAVAGVVQVDNQIEVKR